MSANETGLTPNKFAGAISEPTELEAINELRELIELWQKAAMDHEFEDSVCSKRLRMWEETINSPASE